MVSVVVRMWFALVVACGGDVTDQAPDGGSDASGLVGVEVTPTNPRLPVSMSRQLTATGVFRDHTTRDLTSQVAWTSEEPATLAVSASGLATGRAAGASTVTAALDGLTGTTTVTVTDATLTSLVVTPPDPRLPLGTAQQLVATGMFDDATHHDVTDQVAWASESPVIAQVSNGFGTRGTVTARGSGTTRITAALSGVTGATTVTVVPVTLVSIAVAPQDPQVPLGRTQQMIATGTYNDTTTRDLTGEVTWSSDAPALVEISNAAARGVATAHIRGTVGIAATLSGVTGATTVTASAAVVTSLALFPVVVPVGLAQRIGAFAKFSDATTRDVTDQVTWSSGNPAFATISNAAESRGLVTALAIGQAQITAVLDGITATTTATIIDAVPTSIAVTPADRSLAVGLRQGYRATGQFTDSTTRDVTDDVTWDVLDSNIAVMLSGVHGVVAARAEGQTQIRARIRDVVGTANLTVTPVALVSLAVQPSFPTLPRSFSRSFTAFKVFSDGTTQDATDQVTWSSSDPTCATISNADGTHGVATGQSPGSTAIRAELAGVASTTALTVTGAVLRDIVFPLLPSALAVGLTVQATATGVFSDQTGLDLTSQVTWTSLTPAVVRVSNADGTRGALTGLAEGLADITATVGTLSRTLRVHVDRPVPLTIALSPENPRVVDGRTVQLTAIGSLSDGSIADVTADCTWTSSNTAIATVSDSAGTRGLVTTRAASSTPARITAKVGNVIGATDVTVTAAVIDSIELASNPSSMPLGSSYTAEAIARFSDGFSQPISDLVTWSSDHPEVASFSASGHVLTAHTRGTATITATRDGVSGSRTITVTAPVLAAVAIRPDDASVPLGRSVQLTLIGTLTDGTSQDLTSQAAWTSSSPSVATVTTTGARGRLTTLLRGTTTIRASVGTTGAPATVDQLFLNVVAPVLDAIAVTPAQASLAIAQTRAFTARGTFSDASTLDLTGQVTWASSAPDIATISNLAGSRGVATAVAAGTTSITATLGNVTSQAPSTLTVTAAAAASASSATSTAASAPRQLSGARSRASSFQNASLVR